MPSSGSQPSGEIRRCTDSDSRSLGALQAREMRKEVRPGRRRKREEKDQSARQSETPVSHTLPESTGALIHPCETHRESPWDTRDTMSSRHGTSMQTSHSVTFSQVTATSPSPSHSTQRQTATTAITTTRKPEAAVPFAVGPTCVMAHGSSCVPFSGLLKTQVPVTTRG